MHQAMHGAGHGTSGLLFDHLGNGQIRPRHQTRTPSSARLSRPKGFAHHINVGSHAIAHEQQRPPLGAGGHHGHQPCDQVTVATRADRPATAGC